MKGKYNSNEAIAKRDSQMQEVKQLCLTNNTYALAYKSLSYQTEKELNLVEVEWAQSY